MHWIQAAITYLQSLHNHQTFISAPPHHCLDSSQHLLFICCYSHLFTYINFFMINDPFDISHLVSQTHFLLCSVNLIPPQTPILFFPCFLWWISFLLSVSLSFFHCCFTQIILTIDWLRSFWLLPFLNFLAFVFVSLRYFFCIAQCCR